MTTVTRVKTLPVIEVFGPTVQGEGLLAGLPTYFVRFGGCDYRCSWCDSMYAVEPAQVRANAEKLQAGEIVDRLLALEIGPEWVTLSGGNPALFDLSELVDRLQDGGLKVSVETQASRWKDWLGDVECLTVSPKPPSSGMVTARHRSETIEFMARATAVVPEPARALKIVVFDEADYEWARTTVLEHRSWPAFLSVGTSPIGWWGTEVVKGTSARQARDQIGDSYRWLCEKVAGDPVMAQVRVLPQLHVLAWGHSKGV